MKTIFRFLTIALLTHAVISTVSAALIYNEALDGDLSGDGNTPTALAFGNGENFITGTMGKHPVSGVLDRDIFTFTLAPQQQLTSILVIEISLADNSFYAIASGGTISLTNAATHLSNILVGPAEEILDNLDAGPEFNGTGLTAPLGAGTYTVWFQETSVQRNYRMSYTVVPEPSTWMTLALSFGMGGGLLLRKRKMEKSI